MRERFYSTAELARICGVSISTIKRWTDSGLLRCVRTPGGHRKFRVQDVAEAARRLGTTIVAAEAPAPPAAEVDELALLLMQNNREALIARLAEALEVGDASAARRLLLDLHRHGMRLGDLAEHVLLGALDALHHRHGQIDDFVMRRAERLAEGCVQHLIELLPPAGSGAATAMVASNAGSGDTLWPALCSLVLSELGWSVVDLGCGVRLQTLHRGLARAYPRLVVLLHCSASGAELEELQVAAETHGAALLTLSGVGGAPCALRLLHDRACERERHLAATVV
jgi:excisionase family DNA binding protein